MKERIQKILANAGLASRRNVEEMIRMGRVAVNGKIVYNLPVLIDPDLDRVEVDGEPLRLKTRSHEKRVYLLMNKPKGVYCTNVAQGAQTRCVDLLPPEFATRVYPVGRLDSEAKGLVLLTNDGELANQLTHPRFSVAKAYRATIDGFVSPETIEQLQRGVYLADKQGQGFRTGRAIIKIVNRSRVRSTLEITLREGRNAQVRRALAKLGHKVRDLTRIKLGPLTLQGLPVGHVRALSPKEVRELKQSPLEHGTRGKSAGPRAATSAPQDEPEGGVDDLADDQ